MQRASSETIVLDAERSFEPAISRPQLSTLPAELCVLFLVLQLVIYHIFKCFISVVSVLVILWVKQHASFQCEEYFELNNMSETQGIKGMATDTFQRNLW